MARELDNFTSPSFGGGSNKGIFSGNRDYLDDDLEAITVDQRQRLLQGNQIVDQSSDRLANAHRLALQNEEIGSEIILSLGEQREQIERSYDKMFDVNENLDRGRRILQGINRRVLTNKLVLLVIILILILSIAAIIYLKWLRKLIQK